MGQAATTHQAIEAWRELMSADASEDEAGGRHIDKWERQILDAPIEGSHHAAAICDIVANSIEGGARSDERDLAAVMRLADWLRGHVSGVLTTSLEALTGKHNLDGCEPDVFYRRGESEGGPAWLKWSITTSETESDEPELKPD